MMDKTYILKINKSVVFKFNDLQEAIQMAEFAVRQGCSIELEGVLFD